jgi:hypothetical protein
MLGVTAFGIFLTPVFYSVIQKFGSSTRVVHDVSESVSHKNGSHKESIQPLNGAVHKEGVASPESAVTLNGKSVHADAGPVPVAKHE